MLDVYRQIVKNVEVYQPWLGEDGHSYHTSKTGETNPSDFPAVLRKDQWALLKETVTKHADMRMRVTNWLRKQTGVASHLCDMAKMTYGHKDADVQEGLATPTLMEIKTVPMPFVHREFTYDKDTVSAMSAAYRVGEAIESMVMGTPYPGQGDNVPTGFCNHPGVIRARAQSPREMVGILRERRFFGPYLYLYSNKDNNPTVLSGAMATEGTLYAMACDVLPAGDRVVIECVPSTVQLLVEMEPQPVQMPDGRLCVAAVIVPMVRSNTSYHTGVAYYQGGG